MLGGAERWRVRAEEAETGHLTGVDPSQWLPWRAGEQKVTEGLTGFSFFGVRGFPVLMGLACLGKPVTVVGF